MNKLDAKYAMMSLERNRYQPRFDERISRLPVYLSEEINSLKAIASEEHWTLDSYSRSYSNNQDPPLYNANSFYEYLDEGLDPNMISLLLEDMTRMPLYINDEQAWCRAMSRWRLKIGK